MSFIRDAEQKLRLDMTHGGCQHRGSLSRRRTTGMELSSFAPMKTLEAFINVKKVITVAVL